MGGHVNFGKSYIETAVRELNEELGLSIADSDLNFKGQVLVKLPKNNEFFYVYEYRLKPNDQIHISIDEVVNTKWMKIEEIKKSIADKSLNWYTRPEQIIRALY